MPLRSSKPSLPTPLPAATSAKQQGAARKKNEEEGGAAVLPPLPLSKGLGAGRVQAQPPASAAAAPSSQYASPEGPFGLASFFYQSQQQQREEDSVEREVLRRVARAREEKVQRKREARAARHKLL